mgnify:FL=1
MKLIRFGEPGKEKPGIRIDDQSYDLAGFGEDFDENFFGTDGISRLRKYVEQRRGELRPIPDGVRLGAPLARPSKIICIGLNYVDHAKESNAAIPTEPILFFKSTSALVGPNDDLIIPKGAQKTDWEVELAVVIGKKASYVEEKDAVSHIAGYCLHNDYSERHFQLERGGQWVKGKSCDSFAPMGPFIATADEIQDTNNLRLWLKVNDQMMQDGNTADLIFKAPYLVHYVSQFMTLLPGDIISTGTPKGVGMGIKPNPIYLKAGDKVELGIDGLGSSSQKVKAWA